MGESTHYERLVQERKDALHASLTAWCRREGKSRAEFAELLADATGYEVTESKLNHWLERGAIQRQMPAVMDSYWRQITRFRPASERDSAMQAINRMEASA